MMKLAKLICIVPSAISLSLLLTACVSAPNMEQQSQPAAVTNGATESAQSVALTSRPFPEDALYQLLVADVALTRGQFKTALENYLSQARLTRDVGIIQLTNSIASHQRDAGAILETAELWLDAQPNQPLAHHAALQAYALHNRPFDALQQGYWLYRNENDIEAFLAVTAISEGRKKTLIPELIEAYRALPLSAEKQPLAELAAAILYRESGDLDSAAQTARGFLTLLPDNERGLLLLAQVLHQQDNIDAAADLLADALRRVPEKRNVRLQYARFLTLIDRPQAIVQFELLRKDNANDQQINFLLALLYLNQGDEDLALTLFQQATNDPGMAADAHFHLATIAERHSNFATTLQHYQQVRFGRNYLSAASRAASLLAYQFNIDAAQRYLQRLRKEQPGQSAALIQVESNLLVSNNQNEQALNILSSALQRHPNDAQLLYARSMVAELENNFALAEQDLRALLALDENNSTALNALGYTMILHTDRLEEAYTLIKRAYLLNPGDPAIIDSMGWVLFVMGEAEQALPHLEKAMTIMPDPEVAAHLGEVQWVLGDRQAALQTWNQGLTQTPGHRTIKSTMQRLGADPRTEHQEFNTEQSQ